SPRPASLRDLHPFPTRRSSDLFTVAPQTTQQPSQERFFALILFWLFLIFVWAFLQLVPQVQIHCCLPLNHTLTMTDDSEIWFITTLSSYSVVTKDGLCEQSHTV